MQKRNYLKLLVIIFALLIFSTLLYIFLILPSLRDDIYNEKMIHTREMVDVGYSILQRYYALEEKGSIDKVEAQKQAAQMIRELNYGKRGLDYFWINNYDHYVIVHPFRADLEGENVYDFEDPDGFKLFQEFVNICKEYDGGHVSYSWQYYDETNRFEEKLSYVHCFKPYLGQKCYNAWYNRNEPCPDCHVKKALELGRLYRGSIKSPEGRYWQVTASPVFDENGQVLGVIDTALDISDLKNAEWELKKLNEELEQRVRQRTAELEWTNKELAAFTYSVSHDLRAPLRSIKGFSEAMLEDHSQYLEKDGRDHLERVVAASQRMSDLIDDLLKLSRVTRQELYRDIVDFSAMVEAYAVHLQEQEPERKAEFIIASGLYVSGDAALLRIALENLMDNAWKFTNYNTKTIIEFGSITRDNKESFFISDNGVGFESEHAEKIFNAFHRLHSPEKYPGTGIGLSIVQRIIERHGGKIWAESQPGKGSYFYFIIN